MAAPSNFLQDWIALGRTDLADPLLELRDSLEVFLYDYFNGGLMQELSGLTPDDFANSGYPALIRMTPAKAVAMVTAMQAIDAALGELTDGNAGNIRLFLK